MRPNSIIQVTKPDALPLELIKVKRYLKIDHSHDDELLNMLIFAVGCKCESYTGLSLISKRWQAQYSGFSNRLNIPIRPLQEVISVEVINNSGRSAIISNKMYRVAEDHISLDAAVPMSKINVLFNAGFGDSNIDVPGDLQMVMLSHLADLYETRGAQSNFTMDGYNDFRLFKI